MNSHAGHLLTLGFALVSPLAFCAEPAAPDYAQPPLLTGTVFATDSGTNNVLFRFKRAATKTNSTVHVVRDFFEPNGNLAARELMTFEHGQLVAFQLDETQTGARGTATVAPDAKDARKQKLLLDWTAGGKKKTDSETLQKDTLVGDMIAYFIAAHWRELARGDTVPFRFIAASRLETVGFELVKEADVTWRGHPAVRLRMEASNFVIARIVDPLFFIVEKDGEHRVFEYVGRVAPKAKDGSKWKDLDARTVYDWP